MKKLLVLVLSALMVLSLAACSSKGGDTPTGAMKDTIIWAISNDQDTLDPQNNVSNSVVLPQIYSSLLFVNAENEMVTDLAAEMPTVDETGCVWTFKLKEGVKFQQGQALTSADVKATFDRMMDTSDQQRYCAQTNNFIKEVRVVDDYTVEFETWEPTGAFLSYMTGCNYSILCKETIEKYGKDDNFGMGVLLDSINGTGPYSISEWNYQENMTFTAFDEYFGGAPKTKTIKMVYTPDQASRCLALETGECDIASGLSPDDDVRILAGEVAGVKLYSVPGNGMHEFQFNCAGTLADPVLRQAVVAGVDSEAIVKALYSPIGEGPATAPVTPDVACSSTLGVQPFDQELAKSLLASKGYTAENPLNIKIFTTAVYNKGVEMAEIIKEQLKEVNINVELITGDRAQFLAQFDYNKLENNMPEWDLTIMGMGGSSDTGIALDRVCRTEHHEKFGDNNTNVNNYGFYSNKDFDALLDKAKVMTDTAARTEVYKEAMQILWWDDPFGVWMNFRNDIYGMSEKVSGFKVTASNTPSFELIECAE